MTRGSSIQLRLLMTFALLLATFSAFCDEVSYTVNFSGQVDRDVQRLLYDHSQLVALRNRPPGSITSLKSRARADIPNLLQGLHSLAYFNAVIDIDVDESTNPVLVNIQVNTGPVFTLNSFRILPASDCEQTDTLEEALERGRLFLQKDLFKSAEDDEEFNWNVESSTEENPQFLPDEPAEQTESNDELDLKSIELKSFGLELRSPALPLMILEAEDALLEWINCQGYPMAKVQKREIIADQANYTVDVTLYVFVGPLAYLSFPKISGSTHVRQEYIARKVAWCEGDHYTPETIDRTFNALECSGLFRSINIELGTELEEDGLLPVDIIVSDGKQRGIGLGLNYSTEYGAGVIGEWTHRNVGGMGESVTFKGELLRRMQSGSAIYRIPDFLCPGLTLVNKGEFEREITDSFHETAWIYSSRLHRRLTCYLQGWIGLALKYTYSTKTDNDRHFTLLEIPMQLRHSNVANILDPKYGHSINIKFSPTYQLFTPDHLNYYTTTLDTAFYVPAPWSDCWTFATKMSVGSIVGAMLKSIPPPERFYAGTPSLLRGYRYLTVSPLDSEGRPEGGRSLLVLSMEARWRYNEDWGLVGFWEIGNVYTQRVPRLTKPQFQSTGLGVRYYTPVGPLRLDIAFPVNRRKAIDPWYQLYFSIGQTF